MKPKSLHVKVIRVWRSAVTHVDVWRGPLFRRRPVMADNYNYENDSDSDDNDDNCRRK